MRMFPFFLFISEPVVVVDRTFVAYGDNVVVVTVETTYTLVTVI